MSLTQDLQYHDVKYIVDKVYEQRSIVRQKIRLYRQYTKDKDTSRASVKRQEISQSYYLYRIYQKQMQEMYSNYMAQIEFTPTTAMPYLQKVSA